MRSNKLILLLFGFFITFYSASLFSAQSIPIVDLQQTFKEGKASLKGDWALSWGEWTELDKIAKSEFDYDVVQLPNFVSSLVNNKTLDEKRFGTYSIRLTNLETIFNEPAIRMRDVNDAWQAWWIDDSGKILFLGESGNISKTVESQQMLFKTQILRLPQNVNAGTLVVYLSAQLYNRAGMYGEFQVSELESLNKSLLSDLASRVALIAVGLLVVFQNIVFYLFRPKERVLLLLALFAFSILLRAAVSTEYVYYLLGDPNYFTMLLKLEYITIVWPAVAATRFFAYLYPTKYSSYMVKLGYPIMAIVILFTFISPIESVVSKLIYYQGLLGIFGFYSLWLLVRSAIESSSQSKLMILSCIVLLCGGINDVFAASSSAYNTYLAEYALFLFLFVQTQYHSLRFVRALDTAEHLTNNLKQEVAQKTNELSIRNRELEDKAEYLKLQHDRIKELSETDHLTGLYNRQTFDSFLDKTFDQANQHGNKLSLAMLDIDNFKNINDSFGHQVGDDCLKVVAEFLRDANLRKNDFVARYGGEEIVIVLINTDISLARVISQRICDGLSQIEMCADQNPIALTASFGVSEITHNNVKTSIELLKLADDALYEAKAQGKNRVVIAS
mgnify:CR=1 FL=1